MEVKPGYRQTEVGIIPEDWKLLAFDTLGKVIDGDRGANYPSDREFHESGYCLFLNASNVTRDGFKFDECAFITREKDGKLSKGKLKREDVVLTTRGTVGNFAYYDLSVPFENVRINSGMVILRAESSELTPHFLYALLQSHSVGMQIERLSFGSAQPQLTVKGISKLGITVPTLCEQHAIAQALSDADQLLGALDGLIAKKRDLKQAAMQQLLSGQTRLPGFHGDWEAVDFGQVATVRNAKVRTSAMPSGTPCVELESIDQNTGRLLGTGEALGSSTKYRFIRGDVLFGRLRAYLRKFWYATFDGICSTEIWPLMPLDQRLISAFLHLLVQTNAFVEAAGVAYGTHMPRSDWGVLRKFPAKLPPPDEQTAIAAVLSDMDAELAALEQRREKTLALKQAMMQELLTGRTRLGAVRVSLA